MNLITNATIILLSIAVIYLSSKLMKEKKSNTDLNLNGNHIDYIEKNSLKLEKYKGDELIKFSSELLKENRLIEALSALVTAKKKDFSMITKEELLTKIVDLSFHINYNEHAKLILDELREINPSNQNIYSSLIYYYNQKHSYDIAKETLEDGFYHCKETYILSKIKGDFYRYEDDYPSAILEYKKALAEKPDYIYVHELLAISYEMIGEKELVDEQIRLLISYQYDISEIMSTIKKLREPLLPAI